MQSMRHRAQPMSALHRPGGRRRQGRGHGIGECFLVCRGSLPQPPERVGWAKNATLSSRGSASQPQIAVSDMWPIRARVRPLRPLVGLAVDKRPSGKTIIGSDHPDGDGEPDPGPLISTRVCCGRSPATRAISL